MAYLPLKDCMSHFPNAPELFHIPNTVAAESASDQLNLPGRNGVVVNLPVNGACFDWAGVIAMANQCHSIHTPQQLITGCKKAKNGREVQNKKHG